MKLIWIVIVFVCGALLPLQTGFNAALGKSLGSSTFSSLVCFIVGAIAMTMSLPFTAEPISWQGLKSATILSLIGGGIVGAVFITASMSAMPRLGMALMFGLVVAGQVIMAVLLDHFNIMVASQSSLNVGKLVGIALIILGVVVVGKN